MQELLSRSLATRDGASGGVADVGAPIPAPRHHLTRPDTTQVQAPHKLSPNVSLREYKVWRSAWADYEELLQHREQPVRTQLVHFRLCLTPEMGCTLAYAIGIAEDDDTLPVKEEFSDVLGDSGDFDNGAKLATMVGPPMMIHLRPDSQPFARLTPNSIPLAWQADTKAMLDEHLAVFESPLTCRSLIRRCFDRRIHPRRPAPRRCSPDALRSSSPDGNTSTPACIRSQWQAADEECDAKLSAGMEKAEWYYNCSSRALAPLCIGTPVRIQDCKSRRCNRQGVVVGIVTTEITTTKLQVGGYSGGTASTYVLAMRLHQLRPLVNPRPLLMYVIAARFGSRRHRQPLSRSAEVHVNAEVRTASFRNLFPPGREM
ncbi:hypothetical protein GWK47_041385 [Chionoecetes opilio]|uniref:Uncharacterized protein n=1 Tax=Chionoecetes opilio TaxID=41210 RepID=A0A8J4YBG7_CHIOP|nr:hypothetical protein GWK47_041385 [Chionoecetes opilio]